MKNNLSIGDQAKSHFHKMPENYNCAQSVLKAFDQTEDIDSFRAYGGGRAPDGCCGALFAAKSLLSKEKDKERLSLMFMEDVGSIKCKEIRGKNEVPCSECVKIAADCLSKMELIP